MAHIRFTYPTHSHSIINERREASSGAGFPVVISTNTMKNTIIGSFFKNFYTLLNILPFRTKIYFTRQGVIQTRGNSSPLLGTILKNVERPRETI